MRAYFLCGFISSALFLLSAHSLHAHGLAQFAQDLRATRSSAACVGFIELLVTDPRFSGKRTSLSASTSDQGVASQTRAGLRAMIDDALAYAQRGKTIEPGEVERMRRVLDLWVGTSERAPTGDDALEIWMWSSRADAQHALYALASAYEEALELREGGPVSAAPAASPSPPAEVVPVHQLPRVLAEPASLGNQNGSSAAAVTELPSAAPKISRVKTLLGKLVLPLHMASIGLLLAYLQGRSDPRTVEILSPYVPFANAWLIGNFAVEFVRLVAKIFKKSARGAVSTLAAVSTPVAAGTDKAIKEGAAFLRWILAQNQTHPAAFNRTGAFVTFAPSVQLPADRKSWPPAWQHKKDITGVQLLVISGPSPQAIRSELPGRSAARVEEVPPFPLPKPVADVRANEDATWTLIFAFPY